MSIPWVEKYRPKKLDNIVQQDEVIKVLKATIETGEMPHLLFYGPPGTGKTSTIHAAAIQLFGPNRIEERIIELNASDDRGIGIVRNSIITFSKIAIGTPDPNYPSPPFKIVILDEADAMTPEAQAALRRVMETTSVITRFCLICNYITQIIEPITSRCMKFRFKPVDSSAIIDKLNFIAKKEDVHIGQNEINKIAEISEGDVRRAITILQNLKYLDQHKNAISVHDITQITGGIDAKNLADLWKICIKGSVIKVRNAAADLCRNGYQIQNVLHHIKNETLESSLSDVQKATIMLELCNTDKRLSESSDEYLQILHILLLINQVSKNNIQL